MTLTWLVFGIKKVCREGSLVKVVYKSVHLQTFALSTLLRSVKLLFFILQSIL